MKHLSKLFLIALVTLNPLAGSLDAEEPHKAANSEAMVKELWKLAIVEDQRSYDPMIKDLQKIMAQNIGSNEALTAQFIIGRLELDRTQNEALGSFQNAKAVLQPLAAKHPTTWQGQMAQIVYLHILQLEDHHREVINGARKAIDDIDWDLFGKNAPADLAEFLKMMEDKSQLKPDVLRVFIVQSHLELKEVKEAGEWILKIQDEQIRGDLQKQLNAQ